MNPFEGYRISSPFGWRDSPIKGGREFHTGIDLVKASQSPIYAFVAGEVMHAKLGETGSGLGNYGIVVAIKDPKTGHLHIYAHLDMAVVKVGQKIEIGNMIGRLGNTGQSTGPHLHYEIRKTSSPSFGYIAYRPNNCFEPTAYLQELAPKVPEKVEEEIDMKELDALKKEVVTLKSELKDMEEKQAVTRAPEWFVKEFGKDALTGLVSDPTGDYGFWRNLATTLRIFKTKK
ncbi:M23 family metallopeptidase [Paenibacillus eucommiae]|uniref:Murein DD-endopeptidase MepM/ murein hydrolase activator NlpD n=1 Tax=Paenibacillus eucommiae TaxID=1355755 RepID=A0ABS4IY89_9BACL|nr:M23 family metallopeptidase [Paenibacillus eucommiae]MBP1992558.1 murein DD-endopeptidase MepM/ murein hydrolase activator NlpD [Paenibacillus eucommiae]